jgi:hypothetical protein
VVLTVTVVDLSGVTGLVQVVMGSSQHWCGWLGAVVSEICGVVF